MLPLRFLAFSCLCAATPSLGAQITLTDAYFPRVGDSLLTNQATDAYRDGVVFQAPGADLTWDFGFPEAASAYTERLEAVNDDSVFVNAEMRLTSAAFDYEYYRATETTYDLVGLVGSLPFFREETFATQLLPPRPVRRAGITYGDAFETTSVRELKLAVDELPDDVLNSTTGRALRNYDSIRIESTSERSDIVDAYGTLTLMGETYTVLREKRVEQMETRVYVKTGTSDFLDVTNLIASADPATGQYVGRQPEEGTYFFWAEGELEPIVEIEFDEDETPTTFLYKRGDKRTAVVRGPETVVEALEVFPNPVTDLATLRYVLRRPDRVSVRLRDATGRVAETWPLTERPAGEHRLEASLGSLPRGVYYLEVATSGGRSVQKLIKQ